MLATRLLAFIMFVFLSSGCSILGHLDELSTLGDYSRDKDNQGKEVKLINDHYDALVKAINDKQMDSFSTQVDIRTTFGEPITIRLIETKDKKFERWTYRYAVIKQAKDRVYLYFDEKGKLVKYEQEKIQW